MSYIFNYIIIIEAFNTNMNNTIIESANQSYNKT